jgi:tetratricopeptide (TPR) repeat protein
MFRVRRSAGLAAVIGLVCLVTTPSDCAEGQIEEATSLAGQPLYRLQFDSERLLALEEKLAQARRAHAEAPDDPESLIWLGRRTAYLGRYTEAITIFGKGIERFPEDARFYRHRGHRYITTRQLDAAIADLEAAARLVEGRPDEVEPDGMPNAAGIPTSTLHTNIHYHLGLAFYLQGRFEAALPAYEKCLEASKNDDMRVATLDWLYMTLRRLGREDDAAKALEPIRADIKLLENHAYHRRLLMYKGQLDPGALLEVEPGQDADLTFATQGYGVGNWYLYSGKVERAKEIFRRVLAGRYWPAFGHIAAEADLARLESR